MSEYKDILRDALNEIKDKELESLPAEKEIDYEFSGKFGKKSKRLIKAQKKAGKRSPAKTLIKVAAVIMATIVAVAIVSKTNASPDKFIDFLYYVYEKYFIVAYDTNDTLETDEYIEYTLKVVPDGFEEASYRKIYYKSTTLWQHNNEDFTIRLVQLDGLTSVKNRINSEQGTIEEFTTGSVDVVCVTNSTHILCFWTEGSYKFELSYPKHLGKEFAFANIGKLIEREDA